MGKRLDFEKETKRGIVRQRGFEAVEPGDTTLTRSGYFRSDEGGSADVVYRGPEPTRGPRKARRPKKAVAVQVAAAGHASTNAGRQAGSGDTPVKTPAPAKTPAKEIQQRPKARISIKAPAPRLLGSELPKVVQQSFPYGVTRNVTVEAKPLLPFARSRGGKK